MSDLIERPKSIGEAWRKLIQQQAEIKQLELELDMSNEPGAFDEIERLRQEYDQLQNRTSDQYDEQQAEIERLLALLKSHQVWSDKEIEMYRAALEEEK